MPRAQLRWSDQARNEYYDAVEWYARTAGLAVSDRFVNAVAATEKSISERPFVGSQRFSPGMKAGDLRFRKVGRFPYLMFYVEQDERIRILRVLHESRDIPQHLR